MNLYSLLQKPKLYETDASIWIDKYISPQMHKAHLNPNNDAASYRPERIKKICSYLMDKLSLTQGTKLMDLGCGPGLYAKRFSQAGVLVTGLDMSEYSLNYARKQAEKEGYDITYILQNYLEPFGANGFDAAIIISDDYGVLSFTDRIKLLGNIYTSLRPGGKFAFDIPSEKVWETLSDNSSWYTQESGFLRPHPHTALSKTWLFPEEKASCDVCVVIDENITRYINNQTYFTSERITGELESAGFIIEDILNNLDGVPYDGNENQMGVIARKP